MARHIWIIEMKEKAGWRPTVGIGLIRKIARQKLPLWRVRNQSDKFRITKYIPDPEQCNPIDKEG